MKLVLTEAALADLRAIRSYTLATWGAEQEQRYLRTLWSRIESLRKDPTSYRLRDELFPGCRIAAEGRHAILFRASTETLAIVRILHSAMDFKRQLPPTWLDLGE
jgi:toxin ParE1/3/4